MESRPLFSVCIPAYNRARFLGPLLDSVLAQDCRDFRVVICEDRSPEREQIAEIVKDYQARHPGLIDYHENEKNLGYDGNIRNLIDRATGAYCFFLGNDDLMVAGALAQVEGILKRHGNVGMVLKSYAWFDGAPEKISQTVRYHPEEILFQAGRPAILACYRRSGVIAGYIVNRDAAAACATSKYDGTLYYQMHVTASVLAGMNAVATPQVLVLCRNSEPPDFGHSGSEKGKYVPGRYTQQARLNMVRGAIAIITDHQAQTGLDLAGPVIRDYANYFYAFIRDQLQLPFKDYWRLYRDFSRMGFGKHFMFHAYFAACYVLKEKGSDWVVSQVRKVLGRSPSFG